MDFLKKLYRLLCTPVRSNSTFYISLFCLFATSILFIEYGRCSRMRAGLEVFSDIYFICLLVSIIPLFLRKYVKLILLLLFFLIAIIDMVCYQTMGVALTPNILKTWMLTNHNEASEAVSSYFSLKLLLSPIALLLLTPVVALILKRKNFTLHKTIIALIIPITIISALYGIENKRYLHHTYTRVSDDDMAEYKEFDTMTREYLPIYRLIFSLKEINRFSDMGSILLQKAKETTIDSCSSESASIVLIIGESYNKYHSSLYGYDKNTTPIQKKLYEEGRLIRFNDVISSYNLTFKSIQNMLSFYNADKEGKWYDYPVIMPIFRKAGYKVDMFSNQYCITKKSAFSDFIEDMFINNHQLSPHYFDYRNDSTFSYDIGLLDCHKQICTSDTAPRLTIYHFIGIHAEFNKRYPEEWNKLSADDYNRPDLSKEQRQTLSEYDNAIAYNDYVLGNIIDHYNSKEAILIFVPDHGELVFDGCQEFGRNLQLTEKYVRPQYDIPFWIYCTPKYIEKHATICSQVESSVDNPFMTDDLPHLLLYIAGIKCPDYEEERNLISPLFNKRRKRIIQEIDDYDEICN